MSQTRDGVTDKTAKNGRHTDRKTVIQTAAARSNSGQGKSSQWQIVQTLVTIMYSLSNRESIQASEISLVTSLATIINNRTDLLSVLHLRTAV